MIRTAQRSSVHADPASDVDVDNACLEVRRCGRRVGAAAQKKKDRCTGELNGGHCKRGSLDEDVS